MNPTSTRIRRHIDTAHHVKLALRTRDPGTSARPLSSIPVDSARQFNGIPAGILQPGGLKIFSMAPFLARRSATRYRLMAAVDRHPLTRSGTEIRSEPFLRCRGCAGVDADKDPLFPFERDHGHIRPCVSRLTVSFPLVVKTPGFRRFSTALDPPVISSTRTDSCAPR